MNEVCCSRPVVSSTYEPVGKYETLQDGMKVYTVGNEGSARSIIVLYDAIGYTQQALLGADTLAAKVAARVYVPDFFRGEGVDLNIFPADTEEKKARLRKFFDGAGNFATAVASLPALRRELEAKHPERTRWAAVGFCWGGKVVAMSSAQQEAPFDVSAACHPGLIDPVEASAFTVPHACLLSGEDGSAEERQAYSKALQGNAHETLLEVFEDQVHGWMAARADLQNQRVKEEFERGYSIVSEFFQKYL